MRLMMRPQIRLFSRALLLVGLGTAAGHAAAQAEPVTDELSGIVAGIVHYTRWPDAPATLRLCIDARSELASGAGARRLTDAITLLGPRLFTIDARRLDTASAASVLDCHALYVDAASAAAWQPMLKELISRPVLTIGRGEDFCSWGGQFCLERSSTAPESMRIRANLDSISRSGLRVNPQLLRLTQREPKPSR